MSNAFVSNLLLTIDHELPPFQLVSCTLAEGISEITHAEAEIACSNPLDFKYALEADASLSLTLGVAAQRRWSLKLGGARFAGITAGSYRYKLDLHAPLWLLGLGTTTRKFRDMSTQAIVSQVLRESGVDSAWRLARPTRTRSYTAQYRETHLAFISRLLELEGIAHVTESDGSLLFTDESASAPPVEGGAHFELLDAAGALERGELGVHDLRLRARVTPGAASVNDYNWKAPALSLLQSAWTDENPDLETYDDMAGYRHPEEGAVLARTRLEAQRVLAWSVEGRGNVPSFSPLRRFTFGDAAGPAFAGEYVILQVTHEVRFAAYGDEDAPDGPRHGTTYENRFVAIPRAVPFRPERRTPRPDVEGGHTAMVRGPSGSEIHTDAHGRFKAQFHWDREATGTDRDSRWLRMTQETATSMTLARVGWEVAVGYVDGDPDRPIGLSRQINGVMRPAYSLPASKNMMSIKTPSSPASGGYNELKLDDSLGAMGFHMRAERDFVGLVKNDKSERIGNNETHSVRSNLAHSVGHDQAVTVGANSTTTCGGSEQLVVQKDRTLTVGGNESVDIGAGAGQAIEGNDTERVGSVRLTIAGGFKFPDLKAIAKGLVPVPSVAGLTGALRGAAMSAGQAAAGAMLSGATGAGGTPSLGAAMGQGLASGAATAQASLAAMIPTPAGIAGQLKGLASVDGIVNQITTGSISRSTEKSFGKTVGGAFISVAIGNISTSSSLKYSETIGGVKLTVTATGSIAQKVMGGVVLTVGGAIIRKAKTGISVKTKKSKVSVGGAAKLSSDAGLALQGKVVIVQAAGALSLSGPGATISMTPSSMAIAGDLRLRAGSNIVITGAVDNLTT